MQRLLSTYLFVSRRLTRELLGQIAAAGFSGVEIFCSRAHFDYTSKAEAQAMAVILSDLRLDLTSVHAPTSRDLSATRESGQPLSICEVERVRRVEAMDELKRAIDIAEELPFPRMIFHMGGTRETADPRKRDAAFSSLEHLMLHARHVGATICVENTTSDIGHAHLADGPEEERVEKGFAPLRELISGVHVHANHGEKDEHLPPYDGSIDWPAAIKILKTAPESNVPLLLELKEKTGPEALPATEQLAAARKAMDRFEEAWG